MRYVGIAMDEQELGQMIELAEHIKSKIEHEHTPTLFNPETMAELAISTKNAQSADDSTLTVNLKELEEEQRSINISLDTG